MGIQKRYRIVVDAHKDGKIIFTLDEKFIGDNAHDAAKEACEHARVDLKLMKIEGYSLTYSIG